MHGTRGDHSDEERQLLARVRPVVLGWGSLATIVSAAVVVTTPVPEVDTSSLLWGAGLLLLVMLTGLVNFPVSVGRVHESTAIGEIGLVPVMLLLDPTLAIVVAGSGLVVVEVILTRGAGDRLLKGSFNMTTQLLGVAVGSWIHFTVAGPGMTVTVSSLTVALVAAGSAVAINVAALAMLQATGSRRAWVPVARELTASVAFVNLANSATGILVAALAVSAPLALPLLLVPILVYRGRARERSEGLLQVRLEQDRFERTVAGASHGVVLLGPDGTVEVWNPAMAELSRVTAERALGRRLHDIGWAGLHADREGPGLITHRVTIGDHAVEVRQSDLSGGRGAVLSVQDVSREVELARIREDLVSRISHELRTPLTTVEGFVETLDARWGQLSESERRRLVAIARQGAGRLSQLVDKLLVWSGIEARDPHGAMSSGGPPHGDPVAVLRRRTIADADDLHLDVPEGVDGTITVAMSEHDLDLVLEQLVTNARHHGEPPIVLGVEPDVDVARITVTDHGPGLASEFVPDAFRPFRQGEEGLQRTASGLGLGLAIVHSLVANAGGSVVVERAEGAGARFVISLPRSAAESI